MMLIHLNVEHFKVPLLCIWCDFTTLNDTTLQSHVRTKHEYKKKPCSFEGCHFASIEVNKLQRHIEDHQKKKHDPNKVNVYREFRNIKNCPCVCVTSDLIVFCRTFSDAPGAN